MSVYFLAQITIKDNEEYNKYLAGADQVFARFNGRYLAVDDNPELLEGNRSQGRIVLIEFPCRDDLLRWYQSPEYQAILKYRLKAARCDSLLVNGL